LSIAALGLSSRAKAFGQSGAFHPRVLVVGGKRLSQPRASGPARWSWELVRRTSAPARLQPAEVRADEPQLLHEPFALWAGETESARLAGTELRGLERFLKLGGVLFVDDLDPGVGAFGKSARRELLRVLPDSAVVRLDPNHVIYKTFFILDRPVGRVLGPPYLEAIVRGKYAQVVFSSHDLLGALARSHTTDWALEVEPGGPQQREHAVRLAVNLAMYVLCSDYKDDAVHAPWLMRRRGGRR
jgi:hypothetical protein